MHVFYNPNKSNILPPNESHHAVHVMRLNAGDTVMVLDGKGTISTAAIIAANPKQCEYEIIESRKVQPRAFRLHMVFGILKPTDRMEWFIEKATEIGVDEITPLICDRSERKKINHDRFERVSVAAMKQSMHPFMPIINPLVTFREFIETHIPGYIAHCNDGIRMPLKDFDKSLNSVTILIGPEGDFSDSEIENALSAGWQPVSLGESRLRAETAAIVACHSIHLLKN
jgi:16S rRNA (uracil1498-N3)-methyltransferase